MLCTRCLYLLTAAAPPLGCPQVPEDVKSKVEAKAKELKEAIPSDDVAKVCARPRRPPAPFPKGVRPPRACSHAWRQHRMVLELQLKDSHSAFLALPLTCCLGRLPPPPPQIKAAMEELQKEVMSLGQAVYGQQGGAAPGPDAGAGAGGSGSSGPKAGGDDVIDAEFTDSK